MALQDAHALALQALAENLCHQTYFGNHLTHAAGGRIYHCTQNQRTPWGGGKGRGVENLTNDTPPKKGFWTPPPTVRFPPPSGVSALFFLYKKSTTEQTRGSFGGVRKFSGERVLWYVFPPPYVLHPPIPPPNKMITEPIFTIFELFSVIPVLRLPNRIVSRIS